MIKFFSNRFSLFHQEHGNAYVETVLVIPLVIYLIGISVDYGRGLKEERVMMDAARIAAHTAARSTNVATGAELSDIAREAANFYFTDMNFEPSNYDISIRQKPMAGFQLLAGGTAEGIEVAISRRLGASRGLIRLALSPSNSLTPGRSLFESCVRSAFRVQSGLRPREEIRDPQC